MTADSSREIDVSIVLVGLNARDFIKQCIESCAAAEWRDRTYEVIYVDNGSTDGSVAMIEENFPNVKLIDNGENLGYCIAANQGAAISSGRYYFFLNDDTIVLDDAIALLVDFMDAEPGAACVGSRLLNHDYTDQWSGRRFPSMLNGLFGRRGFLTRIFPNAPPVVKYLYKDRINQSEPFVADWVSAAAMLIRPANFEAVGGFAEDYYYWHEPVICDRLRRRTGGEIYLHPRSRIVHFEGHGSGKRPYQMRRKLIIDFHSGAYRCYVEHHELGKLNPLRWLAAAALSTRTVLLLAGHKLESLIGAD